ncbi:MAG: dioxygenase family protein [Gaiellaceae bacterium]
MSRLALLAIAMAALGASGTGPEAASRCVPTRADALGPFYEPGAPVRSKVGSGYVMSGRVLTVGCRRIARARIELWLVNPRGQYDDAHRATVLAGRDGRYRFESNRPIAYESRPPHIHVKVGARGFQTLVTQHYPRPGRRGALFNLVLARR